MRNAKHTVVALTAVAMIGSMAVKQAYDFKASNRLAALLSNSAEAEMVFTQSEIKIDPEDAAQQLNETYTQEELEEVINKKSSLQESYVLLTYGNLNVYDAPSEEGNVIDSLEKCDGVEITESTEGFYKIFYNGGKTGYVMKEHVTESKAEADYAAMHYDNYKAAKVKTTGGNVNIRSSASKNSSVIGQLENGSDIVLLYDENGYTKVFFGSDLEAGFVVSTSIELTGAWVSKSDVAAVQKAAAERKAAEAKAAAEKAAAEKAAAEKAKKEAEAKAAAAAAAKKASSKAKKSSGSSGTYTTPAASSKGQAIVNQARKYLGVKYVYGGTSPKGFDCSGLVQYVCKSVGISVNRTAASQFGNGRAVNKKDLQPGDLLFFAKGGRIHHVGIYIGNGQMIHAPQTGDVVKVSSINTAYRKNGYVGARRVY
ncbi:MAG: C40 family peptidase [Clostridia bacterium]|nr:C40 family peptidase [Clostridia bacterium]